MHPGLTSKHNEASAIVADLSQAEKAQLCSGKNFWHLEPIERHGLPAVMLTDGPHGLRQQDRSADHLGLNASVPATCFPTASALASSWDTDLLAAVGDAIGRECVAANVTVVLGPGLNIKRHPYCGRNFEYFSEDPLLTGKLAAAFVNGVQANGVGTSIKHFAVNNQEQGRMVLDAIVDSCALREIYLRGFEIAVKQSQPWTVMCAYNRVNGTYCSENEFLLNTILRREWGFEGLVVTDWGATNDRVLGLQTGLDLEMPGSGGINDRQVMRALRRGELDEQTLDQAITRNVSLSLLGKDLAARDDNVNDNLEENHALARRVAAECTVLLQNNDALLPLRPEMQIAAIGAFCKRPRYQGTGSSQVNPTRLENCWEHLVTHASNVTYSEGYEPKQSEQDVALIAQAVTAARQADVAVVFVGLPAIYESEGFDRTHLALPQQHNDLVNAVCDACNNVVVVLANGAPVAMPWVHRPKAIIEGYLGGQAGGGAIADILFGITNPSGKLAETFPLTADDIPSNKWFPGTPRQVQYREGLFVGYRYFSSCQLPVLFPFGHGLSYTTFDYANLQLSNQDGLVAKFTLTNSGQRTGAEIVQLYVSPPQGSPRPKLELRGFTKVSLAPGESQDIRIEMDEHSFSEFDVSANDWITLGGDFQIHVGASSADLRLHETYRSLSDHQSRYAHLFLEPMAVDDATFTTMLSRPIPPPEGAKPFHLNSAVQDLKVSWLGRRMRRGIVKNFAQGMAGNNDDATLNKMFEEMADNMPLRGLALFSRGAVDFTQIETMIALLNNRYLQAARLRFLPPK